MSTGLANKVTVLRYQTIKQYLEEHDCGAQDDRTVGKIFGVSVTVMRAIRNTRDYDEYIAKIKRWHRKQEKRRHTSHKVIMPSSGLPLEELPIKPCPCKPRESGINISENVLLTLVIILIVIIFFLAAIMPVRVM